MVFGRSSAACRSAPFDEERAVWESVLGAPTA